MSDAPRAIPSSPPVGTVINHAATLQQEFRPWGNFLVLRDEPHYKLKQLQVLPGQRLSLQSHQHRQEHWIVTQGTPEITVDDRTWIAKVGETIFIPQQAKHRLANPTDRLVELIEVQLGASFEESDIVRYADDYQRV